VTSLATPSRPAGAAPPDAPPSDGGSPAERPDPPLPSRTRPEIQALRATAVVLVIVCHLWPSRLPGGYVGVDVFFVISGFLITSMLLREIERSERLSLSRFWARRARRILPAALVTSLACAAATVLFVPLNLWGQFFTELRASTAYVQNWHLAATAVDYFAASDGPSPVQHFWSLSAEEQFYLVWPLLLVVALAAGRGRPAPVRRRLLAAVIVGTTAASLGYSLFETHANPAAAYFVTPTRAWEFGAGGLLALLPAGHRSPEAAHAVLSWVGLAAIAVAAAAFGRRTAFPGAAALVPVAGAVAVIRAGLPTRRWSPAPVIQLPPVQFVGDISYSLYLWHWPLIVLFPFVVGGGAGTARPAVILLLTLGAAWLSKRFVEDPVRSARPLLRRPPAWTLALALAGTGALLALTVGGTAYVEAQARKAAVTSRGVLEGDRRCFGAAVRAPGTRCSDAQWGMTVAPTPIEAKRPGRGCTRLFRLAGKLVCAFGVPPERAVLTVALIGDSHAGHWAPALDAVARANRWRGIHFGHHGCPLSLAVRDLVEPDRSSCGRWKRAVLAWLARHREVSVVVVSELSGGSGVVPRPGVSEFETEVAGYRDAWRALPASVRQIVVIRDTPRVHGDTDTCVQRAIGDGRRPGTACAVARRGALDRDPAAVAAARMRSTRVRTVDLTRFFCGPARCFPVIGGALVFKDVSHLTPAYATSLAPFLRRAIAAPVRRPVRARASGEPRCFGAAARDPRHPCRNPRLRLVVRPNPRVAKQPFGHCRLLFRLVGKQVCGFGVAAGEATETVALIGDSHAGHWKPALDAVARTRGWHGIHLGHASCPLSTATRDLVEPNRSHCARWKRAVFAWFARHPEVSTVFLSQLTGGSGVVPSHGRSELATSRAGYAAAWRRLPPSVKQIVVIRDTPKVHGNTDTCVERAMARRMPAGRACAVPRGVALDRDPAYEAARRLRSRRVRAVDLTRFMCGRRLCYPVVGGALVLKDATHLTGVFAQTLGPYLLRAVAGVGA
jgi:peptidoglycan/LPS O-acetylase OafA/YrhL